MDNKTDQSYRKCVKPWTIPGTDIVIPEGMLAIIPVLGFHNDERYFPEPEVFKPERFSPENKGNIQAGTFLPFGIGKKRVSLKICSQVLNYSFV